MNLKTFYPPYLIKRIRLWRFQQKFPQAPWLTQSAVFLLDTWLKPTDKGLEWGSGRSTLWFAERVESLISIEHHKGWYENVTQQLKDAGVSNKVKFHQLPLDESYENIISNEDDESLNFILVDGRRRLECFKMALPKLKKGGLLILDNSDRYTPNKIMGEHTSIVNQLENGKDAGWQEQLERIKDWRKILTADGINDTTFWVKE